MLPAWYDKAIAINRKKQWVTEILGGPEKKRLSNVTFTVFLDEKLLFNMIQSHLPSTFPHQILISHPNIRATTTKEPQ